MKLSNLPFYLTLISGMLPPVAAFMDIKGLVYLPFLALVVTFLLSIINNKKPIRLTRGSFILLLFLVVHGIGASLIFGHGSLGLAGLAITSIIYVQLFNSSSATIVPDKLIRQLTILYASHVIFLVLELILRVAGYEKLLLSLFGFAENVTKMKNYNSAAFLHFLGFQDNFFGLNGMLLGSQSASQVMLGVFIISAVWYKYSPFMRTQHWLINAVAGLLFLSVVTMTMTMAFVIVLVVMIYVVPFSRINTRFVRFAIPISASVFSGSIATLLLYRIDFDNFERDIGIYLTAFRAPIDVMASMSPIQLLFGVGRIKGMAEAADFGLGMLALQVGVVFIIFIGTAFLGVLVAVWKETRVTVRRHRQLIAERKWVWLATVNALVSLVFALGLLHYTPSIELGGMQMFAFSIALSVVSVRQLRLHRWLRDSRNYFERDASLRGVIST